MPQGSGNEQAVLWLGVAFEAVSFYMVFASRIALREGGLEKAQRIANGAGRLVVQQLASTFLSRNPPAEQTLIVDGFLIAHHKAEADYGACTKVFPEGVDDRAATMISLFTSRLLNAMGAHLVEDQRFVLQTVIVSLRGPDAQRVFSCVSASCKDLTDLN